jgi:tRNA 2-thiouridine synthesizing protein A
MRFHRSGIYDAKTNGAAQDGTIAMSAYELDARPLLCPMPVIRTQNRIAELQPGDTLTVRATDRGALQDVPAWCRINGHEVMRAVQENGEVVITVRVGRR